MQPLGINRGVKPKNQAFMHLSQDPGKIRNQQRRVRTSSHGDWKMRTVDDLEVSLGEGAANCVKCYRNLIDESIMASGI